VGMGMGWEWMMGEVRWGGEPDGRAQLCSA